MNSNGGRKNALPQLARFLIGPPWADFLREAEAGINKVRTFWLFRRSISDSDNFCRLNLGDAYGD